ncbi:hypothetical protein [Candidatus Chlorohelix sp.]|uniref:hypothetical protein n=1 Tax=Candidatus Chlorohelix sp. TaxID=3139201 RepID=UPI003028BCC4
MVKQVTSSSKSPNQIVADSPEPQWLIRLIRQWLQSSMADGLSDATLEDYRDKVFKFQSTEKLFNVL